MDADEFEGLPELRNVSELIDPRDLIEQEHLQLAIAMSLDDQ